MVHRPHRLVDIISLMRQYRIEPKRIRMVHPFADKEANMVRGEDKIISTPDSKVTVCIIPTNEELAIARETVALVG